MGQIEAWAEAERGEEEVVDGAEEEGRLREEAEVLRAELAEQGARASLARSATEELALAQQTLAGGFYITYFVRKSTPLHNRQLNVYYY